MALAAYRHVLRATRVAFANDVSLLHASRDQARNTFKKNASMLLASSLEAETQIQHAEEVAKVLRRNVVQGEHVDEDRWKLNIHQETERGDNFTVKMAGNGTGTIEKGRCLP